jgi:hypothetical protein
MPKNGAYARRGDPSTSHEAAERVRVCKEEQSVVDSLLRFGRKGANCNQVSIDTGVDKWTVSPRFKPLCKKRLAAPKRYRNTGNIVKRNGQMVHVAWEYANEDERQRRMERK